MVVKNTPARAEGRKAMEASLTRAARVRRQLKAGRPSKATSADLDTLQAVLRLAKEADRARTMMADAGLDPDDIRLAILYCTTHRTEAGLYGEVRPKWLPPSKQIGDFIVALENIQSEYRIRYLGILWRQAEHEADDGPPYNVWVTPFMLDPDAQAMMLRAKTRFCEAESRALDN